MLRGGSVTKVSSNYGWMQMDLEVEVANSVMSGLTYFYKFSLPKNCFGKKIKRVFVSFFCLQLLRSADSHEWCGSNFSAGGVGQNNDISVVGSQNFGLYGEGVVS